MKDWKRVRLDECTRIVGGATPASADDSFWNGDICWTTPKDLSDLEGAFISDTPRKLTKSGLDSCSSEILPPGSVLFSSRAPIGHVAINTVPMATNQGFKSFIPDPSLVHAPFLYWWLVANRAFLESLGNGATFKEVSKAVVSRIEIALPPLSYQRRIADILDRADALRAKRRAAIAHLDELAQAIFIDMFGDPVSNPKGLPRDVLGNVASFTGGGTPSRERPEYFTGSICWATSKDMKCEYLCDTEEHITEEGIENSATKLVPASTVLVVVKSKILAHRLPVAIAKVPTCFGQDLKGIIPSERLLGPLIATSLRLNARWLLERARGINTEGLTLDHLRAFPLLIPAIKSQNEFVRRMHSVDHQKTIHRDALALVDALFASLQDRAFRGAL